MFKVSKLMCRSMVSLSYQYRCSLHATRDKTRQLRNNHIKPIEGLIKKYSIDSFTYESAIKCTLSARCGCHTTLVGITDRQCDTAYPHIKMRSIARDVDEQYYLNQKIMHDTQKMERAAYDVTPKSQLCLYCVNNVFLH